MTPQEKRSLECPKPTAWDKIGDLVAVVEDRDLHQLDLTGRMKDIAEVAKQRFRDFAEHVRDVKCTDVLKAVRDRERYRIIIECPCNMRWIFTDAALREAPHIIDYFRICGLDSLVEPVLNHRPIPGAWAKVLLGFLEESQ